MGADLYLKSACSEDLLSKLAEKIAADFHESAAQSAEEAERCAVAAAEANKVLKSEAYFRDAYNAACLLPYLGLDWWRDVLPSVDKSGQLPLDACRKLRDLVASRHVPEERFLKTVGRDFPGDALLKLPPLVGDIRVDPVRMQLESGERSIADLHSILSQKRKRLLWLLDLAIERGEPLCCSL